MYPCKKCRGPVPDGETICPMCGWDQTREPPADEKKVPETIGTPPAAEKKAPETVGKPPAAERKAPETIGNPPASRPVYQPTIRSCPVCGGPLGADDRTCAVCGLQDPLNASPEDIAEYRGRRDREAAEEAARVSEAERWKAQKAAEAEQKKAAVREQIAAREKEAAGVKSKMKIIRAALIAAIAVLAVGAFGMMANSATTGPKTISKDDLPQWTAESKTGDVVRFTVADVEDWFTVTTTTTTTSRDNRLPSYYPSAGSYSTQSYRGFAGLTSEDGGMVYVYYSIPDRNATLTKLAEKYEQVSLAELGEYTIPMVSEPFTIYGKLVKASSVINTSGFDSSSMEKFNEIKDIPFLDISVSSKTITVPIEGAKERLTRFSVIALAGLVLTAAVALVLKKTGKRISEIDSSVRALQRQLNQI